MNSRVIIGPELMQRTPEPELMNDPEQAAAYAAADFSEPHQAFVERFRERFPSFAGGRVLDLGCGNADVTLRFARAYPGASIVGIDAAEAMLDLGREAVERAGRGSSITLECRMLPDPTLAGAGFDAIICNSLLHHLADPLVLWQTARLAGKHGAAVFAMDLRRPESAVTAHELVARHAPDAPPVLKRDFYNSLLAAYTPAEVAMQLVIEGLSLQVETMTDRHMLVWGHV